MTENNMDKAHIIVAGIGPGGEEDITPAVVQALKASDVVIGYKYYFRFITPLLAEGTECVDTGMKREKARATGIRICREGTARLRHQFGRRGDLRNGSADLRDEARAGQ
ncbi:cobalt-precorrin-3b C17-methyltransferase [Bacteroides pyogenes DSM 20611 = JCM 6294]|uniref:Cobalt-precorrin-3b C17-methyltransferase n=1 Tax=Bacteroides pyogenes DSM 20611 = JCM 6294 TaxID=1121100 RepID=W4PFY6_9BACE|nr:cobalt-precorrin-3b C17-methyltransferase [Bacteroides pyogenes DSM 20611 = JCM 6294]